MNIGYACLTIGVPNTNLRSCIFKNANEANLLNIITHNLNSLEQMIDYNIRYGIKLFRISSDLIPFGSSPVNTLAWWQIFEDKFRIIGHKIRENDMRVSMHPGQYTILNSPMQDVVDRAILDLKYHTRVLDTLSVPKSHKIILHIGGVYNDKEVAMERFINNYRKLEEGIKDRLVLENDDRLFNIMDVLEIAAKVEAPVIFDNLHHKMNPCDEAMDEVFWMNECKKTWREEDGCQKIHYSQQNPSKKPGSHSDTINAGEFLEFYHRIHRDDIDIMMEVKDKNLSAVKCMNAVSKYGTIKTLELEWSRYKYSVLERSPNDYKEIRGILKQKDSYPVIPFYDCIDRAMQSDVTIGNGVNAAQHVWGYFKELATEGETNSFRNSLQKYEQGRLSLLAVKKGLWKLTIKYQQRYLLDSYYFSEVIG